MTMEIKIGDYVNGRIVEEISVIDHEKYYLITYFDKDLGKPQSKKLPEHEIENVVPFEEFQLLIKSKKEPVIPDSIQRESIKKLIYTGLVKGTVKVIFSTVDDCPCCLIGDTWFYFLGSEDEDLTPLEIMEIYTKEELTELIFDALKGLGANVINYCIAWLQVN